MDEATPVPTSRRSSSDLVGTMLGGRYRIIGRLGRGGAGHVYLAVQEPLGREVAVKVLRTDLRERAAEMFAARFLREAEAAARLNHRNIVTIYDFGSEQGLQYVVMERLLGDSLSTRIAAGPIPDSEVAQVGWQIAKGLRHAHSKGLIHRDVKPGNIVLHQGDEGFRAVLLDFGLVKPEEEDSQITQVGTYMGTPAYMSPEQASGEWKLDGRADLYSLGCVLFKMLSGSAPFAGPNALATALAHASEPVPSVSDRNPRVSVDPVLEDVVRRCLAKRPEDRWDDAGALAEALGAWLDGRTSESLSRPAPVPELAVTPSVAPVQQAGPAPVQDKPQRKRRWPAAALLLLGLGGGTLGAVGLGTWVMSEGPEGPTTAAVIEDGVNKPGENLTDPVEVEPEAPQPPAETQPQPEQAPQADVVEKPAPEPAVAPAPAPAPAPVVSKPRATPKPASSASVTVDGVYFDGAHAARALELVNTGDEATLRKSGMLTRQINVVLQNRPFVSLTEFGNTYGIGEKTVQAIHRGSK